MIDTFRPLFEAAAGIDLSDPAAAQAELERRLHSGGAQAAELGEQLKALAAEGRIAERGEPPVRYGRVSKASDETLGFSIDVVDMTGPGPHHRHPRGEANFCVALEGQPRFDGEPPGWVVKTPESSHVPTVDGGRMLIVYLLPAGEIEFTKPS